MAGDMADQVTDQDRAHGGKCGGVVPPARIRDWDARWRSAIVHAMARSGKTREEIAAEMTASLTLDRPISKAMIDAFAAPARRGWRFPVAYLPAFIAATGAHWLLHVLAIPCGRRVITLQDARILELGRVAAEIDRLKARERELLDQEVGQLSLPDAGHERL